MCSDAEEITSSFFGNGYITPLGAEISDFIYKTGTCSKDHLVDTLQQRGYSPDAIQEEVERQCFCSTLRVTPEDTCMSIGLGAALWMDICKRIHDQESMMAGRIERRGPHVKMDIYQTDFQFSRLRRTVKDAGFHKAPVMRWTAQFDEREAATLLDPLLGAIPFTDPHTAGDKFSVLKAISGIMSQKSRKLWVWLIVHPVVCLKLTPGAKEWLKTLFRLGNGPVEWGGIPLSFYEIQMNTDLTDEEIEEAFEYLEKVEIVRRVKDEFTPTGLGHTLMRRALKGDKSITFAVTRNTDTEYRLEVSAPSHVGDEVRDVLEAHGGVSDESCTPVSFSPSEGSWVAAVMGEVITKMVEQT